MSAVGDRLAAGFAALLARFEGALTPSRPWRMTGFLFFPAAFVVALRAAGRFAFFIGSSSFRR
jgi:hypothetical protein